MTTRQTTKKLLKWSSISAIVFIIIGYAFFAFRDYLHGPQILISDPVNGSTVNTPSVLVHGMALRIQDITLNDRPILIDKEGNFTETLLLAPGYNASLFKAHDTFHRSIEYKLELIYNSPVPTQ